MSRAERRAYQRMTKNQDPFSPPVSGAAKVRMERQRARRVATRAQADPGSLLGNRGAWWVFGGAVAAFVLALSLAWGDGTHAAFAALVGAAAGIGWLLVTLAFFWWRRRARARAGAERSSARH